MKDVVGFGENIVVKFILFILGVVDGVVDLKNIYIEN